MIRPFVFTVRKPLSFFCILETAIGVIALLSATTCYLRANEASQPYGLNARPQSKPYLSMASSAGGLPPPLLSQTGAFRDTRNLLPDEGLIPYDLIVPFWSDGATKTRWVSVPPGK